MYLLNLIELSKYLSADQRISYDKLTAKLKDLFRNEMELTRTAGNYNEKAVRADIEAKIKAASNQYSKDPCPKNLKALEQASESLHGELDKAKSMVEEIRKLRDQNQKRINTLFETEVVELLIAATDAALIESKRKDADEAGQWGIAASESPVTKALVSFRERARKTLIPAQERIMMGGGHLNGYHFAKNLP